MDERPGGTHCRQSLGAKKAAHNKSIGSIVKLLEKLTEKYWKGKGQHVLINAARSHITGSGFFSIKFFHICITHSTLILHLFSVKNNAKM